MPHMQMRITVGGPRPNALLRTIFEARGRPWIIPWIGTDVTEISAAPATLERLFSTRLVHWAVAPHLVQELAAIGIEARYVPIACTRIPKTVAPMPPNFTVLTYLPAPRRQFYGQRHIWEAAAALPDVRFLAVGRGERERNAPPNVQYLRQVGDMDTWIDASSVLLRITPRDGLSLGVVEALGRGRHVIQTYPYRGVIYAPSPNEAIDCLRELCEALGF